MEPRKLIYLACSYHHPDPDVRDRRFKLASKVAGVLMGRGLDVYSPLSHSVPICDQYGMPSDYWYEFDLRMLARCDELWVLATDGWRESKGVRLETEEARRLGKLIRFVDVNGELFGPVRRYSVQEIRP